MVAVLILVFSGTKVTLHRVKYILDIYITAFTITFLSRLVLELFREESRLSSILMGVSLTFTFMLISPFNTVMVK